MIETGWNKENAPKMWLLVQLYFNEWDNEKDEEEQEEIAYEMNKRSFCV